MQLDRKYAVGAFDYESYHYEGHENDDKTDDGYGGGFIYHENDLVAKKSYFFFDKECVCLGADISSTMNANVLTTVEHRRLVKDTDTAFGLEDITVDGKLMPKAEYSEAGNAKWATLEGVGSYVFLENSNVYYNKYSVKGEMKVADMYYRPDPDDERYGDLGKPFFELGIAHGANPVNATYAYAVLPYADTNAAKAYASDPEIEIISNTPELQVVRKASCGVTFYVFHKAGKCEEFEVSEPCILAKTERGGYYRVTVCDPTQKLDSATVKVARKLTLTEKSREIQVECADTAQLNVSFTFSAGEAFFAEFEA
jgi:hypothetical protein